MARAASLGVSFGQFGVQERLDVSPPLGTVILPSLFILDCCLSSGPPRLHSQFYSGHAICIQQAALHTADGHNLRTLKMPSGWCLLLTRLRHLNFPPSNLSGHRCRRSSAGDLQIWTSVVHEQWLECFNLKQKWFNPCLCLPI